MQIVPPFEVHDGFVQVLTSLAGFVLFRLDVEQGNLLNVSFFDRRSLLIVGKEGVVCKGG